MFARLHVNAKAALAFLAGVVTLAGSALVFGAMTEDVTQHNGQALRDAADLRFFTIHRDAFDVHAAKIATDIGSVPVVAALALLAACLLWRHGQRLLVALAPVAALALGAAVASVAKVIVGRSRPPVALHLVTESDASFPSGHATNSAALFMTIAFVVAVFVLRRPLARVAAVATAGLLAGAIGTSRLVLGVHWPSDVVAGLALGLMSALIVTLAAALLVRIDTLPPQSDGNRLQRVGRRVQRVLTREHQPRRALHAAEGLTQPR